MTSYCTSYSKFTLVELLLVVFILSSLAVVTLTLVNNADQQGRFEDTRVRLERIRAAIVGEPGQDLIQGYAADMGRLPASLEELLQQGAQPDWDYDPTAEAWTGWRGPYLQAPPSSNAEGTFRDGWGTPDQIVDDPNDGWTWSLSDDLQTDDTLTVQSLGLDGASGGSDYAADFPANGPLVRGRDHLVELRGETVTITFTNDSGADWPGSDTEVRVGFYLAKGVWPATEAERDAADHLADAKLTFTAAAPIPSGDSRDIAVTFGGSASKYLPFGRRALVAFKENGEGGAPAFFTTATDGFKIIHDQHTADYRPRAQTPLLDLTPEFTIE